MEENLIRLV